MPPTPSIAAQLQALQGVSTAALRRHYRELFGEDTASHNRDYLFKHITWRLQEQAYGGLSPRAAQRLETLVDTSLIRQRPPHGFQPPVQAGPLPAQQPTPRPPTVGTLLHRRYKGRDLTVTLVDNGVRYDGTLYTSLTAAARAITGTRTSVRLFFGLAGGKEQAE